MNSPRAAPFLAPRWGGAFSFTKSLVGKNLAPQVVGILKGTSLASQITSLCRIATLPPEDQVAEARRYADRPGVWNVSRMQRETVLYW